MTANAQSCEEEAPLSVAEAARFRLRALLAAAIMHGEYLLSHGGETNWYLDAARVTMTAEGMRLVAQVLLDEMPFEAQAVGGLTQGADPLAAACAAHGWRLPWFSVRKAPKEIRAAALVPGGVVRLAEDPYVVGPVSPGMRVVLVEDVVTLGGSLVKACERARAFGLHVVKAVALVGRMPNAAVYERLVRQLNVPLSTVFEAEELLDVRGEGMA